MINQSAIAAEIYSAKGKTIKEIYAHDPFGYDRGFSLEFTDGTYLEVMPMQYKHGARLKFIWEEDKK